MRRPFGRLWWDDIVATVVTRAEPHNQVSVVRLFYKIKCNAVQLLTNYMLIFLANRLSYILIKIECFLYVKMQGYKDFQIAISFSDQSKRGLSFYYFII